ncbi:MAG: hypothetical protein NC089_01250 [Bacteroides sp.]|nr:hypothetical protein [Bacteroides sp.]MCM1549839.1 hypothetical protein [Clostridium sp.]
MQDNFWKNWNEKFDKLHLQDTELRYGVQKIYINPAVKLIAAWAVFVLAFVLFILIGKPFAKEDGIPVGKSGEQTGSNEEFVAFERNEYPEVNSFVENYMKALTSGDMNVLSTMVVDPSQFADGERMQKRMELVLNYSNIDCYTKPGLTEGSYIVYAVMNTQIPDVDVQPLSLHQFYLMPNEFGGFLHNNIASTDVEIEAYMNQIDRDPDVVELYERVDKNNEESAQTDESLRAFYERIGAAMD